MRVLLFINTPAQAHTWRHLIDRLMNEGHRVKILARDYDSTRQILDNCGREYHLLKPIRSKYAKHFEIVGHILRGYKINAKFCADIVVGFGIDASLTAALLRKPCIVLTDSEPIPLQHLLTKLSASVILTPSCFKKDMGKKQIRFAGYKELAYLHPDYFTPDLSVYDELGIHRNEKYVILRFNAFDAVHDIGRHGFSLPGKYELVSELGKWARVFISAEGSLPKDLESYKLPIPYHRIHHALYYAQLLVCDTGTMATEAAVLGTPSILCSSAAGQFGNFIELEQEYDLIYCFREPERAIQKALGLIQQSDLKGGWDDKRQRLLQEKMNVTEFMVWFIENYPESLDECRRKQARTGGS